MRISITKSRGVEMSKLKFKAIYKATGTIYEVTGFDFTKHEVSVYPEIDPPMLPPVLGPVDQATGKRTVTQEWDGAVRADCSLDEVELSQLWFTIFGFGIWRKVK